MTVATILVSGSTYALAGLGLLATLVAAPAAAQPSPAVALAMADPQTGAGIHFPAISSRDTVSVKMGTAESGGSQPRQLFVDQLNLAAISAERPFPIVAQAVGQDRKTLVFMNIESHEFLTPYVARAILARMSSIIRFLPDVANNGLSPDFDIYTLAAILGFERIVVTDGRRFSHEAVLTRAPSR